MPATVPPESAAPAFSGSYLADDVQFLLKPVDLTPTDVAEKEARIQSGAAHYSEMLSAESAPGPDYMGLYRMALAETGPRFARDVAGLARQVDTQHPEGQEIVLVSLARAGTPVGVLLRRALVALGREAPHYSVSIIRDRGIDAVALDHILERHWAESVVFVDGWTGKGAIRGELDRSVPAYAAARGVALTARLAVVADLAGVADMAATGEDYLIPSAILNAVVSGLVSRTVLNDQVVGPGDFHACVYYAELAPVDESRPFVDHLTPMVLDALSGPIPAWGEAERAHHAQRCAGLMDTYMARYAVTDRNRLKPGIGEATRAVLRRMPERVILQDDAAGPIRHLRWLAEQAGVPVETDPALPVQALTLIRSLGR